jgi:hypothetical protein
LIPSIGENKDPKGTLTDKVGVLFICLFAESVVELQIKELDIKGYRRVVEKIREKSKKAIRYWPKDERPREEITK